MMTGSLAVTDHADYSNGGNKDSCISMRQCCMAAFSKT